MIPPVLTIRSLKVLDGRRLHVVLSNGKEGVFDVAPYLRSGFFSELKNPEYFARVETVGGGGGIGWPGGQDLSAYTVEADLREESASAAMRRETVRT